MTNKNLFQQLICAERSQTHFCVSLALTRYSEECLTFHFLLCAAIRLLFVVLG